MNILVTGANGQLGNSIRKASAASKDCYIFTDVAELDITDEFAVRQMIMDNSVDVVINCAAYTNVERAEEERELAYKLNSQAVATLSLATKELRATLIHISTDYVFGGGKNNTPIAEDEPANPTGVYGESKLAGEVAARLNSKHIIIRTAWLYSEFGTNFVKTMLKVTAEQPSRKVVIDQVGTPTYAGDLAEVIFRIVENRKYENNYGTYHYTNEGVCSWYDFAKEIARQSRHTACDIQPCRSSEFPSKVLRPSYSVLDKSKIKRTFGIAVPYWAESLNKCLENLKFQ